MKGPTISRKVGESLIVTTPEGREVIVHLSGLRSNQAKIKILADQSVKVLRSEKLEILGFVP